MHPLLRLSIALLIACWAYAPAQAKSPIKVSSLEAPGLKQLRIDAPQGQLVWGHVARGWARLHGYDDQELGPASGTPTISLSGRCARLARTAFNWVMQPCMQCDIVGPADTPSAIEVTWDRTAALSWINQCKANVRDSLTQADEKSGLTLIGDAGSSQADIVVLVHGLNSQPEDLASLLPCIRNAELVPASFRYPNDQPIRASAQLLSAELKQLHRQFPRRNVRLLTHSMGGLVARATLEHGDLDPGNVRQLIMIAPPNQGSALAHVAMWMDCYEWFTNADARAAGWTATIDDGLAEAAEDLQPGSVFLDDLNRQSRHAAVSYTILLGTQAPVPAEDMRQLRQAVHRATDESKYARFLLSKWNRALRGLDEVVDGRGDGAVATWRGRLKGVDDVVQLPFTHMGVLDSSQVTAQQAYRIVEQRLRRGDT